jgi:hypothetical protein
VRAKAYNNYPTKFKVAFNSTSQATKMRLPQEMQIGLHFIKPGF